MKLNEFLKKLNVKDKIAFNSESELAFEIAEMVIDARVYSGMTQEKLAEKLGTSQPSIARLENGKALPSLKFLLRIAKALNTAIIPPKFKMVQEIEDVSNTKFVWNLILDYKKDPKYKVVQANSSSVNNVSSCMLLG